MKQWTVYYRDRNGAKNSLVINAEDRQGVFVELKNRGILAISISEGANKFPQRLEKKMSAARVADPSIWRGIVAALIIVIGSGAVVFFLMQDTESCSLDAKTKKDVSKGSIIQSSFVASNTITSAIVKKEERVVSTNSQKVGEVRNGMVLLPNGKLHRRRGLKKISSASYPRSKYSIFPNSTDNELAALLMLKPGESLVGGPIRYPDYNKAFLKSLETPILINDDDSEDIKDLKRAIIEVRKTLKNALDNGEDITDIIKSTYDQAHKLATYKEQIDLQIKTVVKEGDYTDDELDLIIKASNEMLEKKGIAPIRPNPLTRARLKILKK